MVFNRYIPGTNPCYIINIYHIKVIRAGLPGMEGAVRRAGLREPARFGHLYVEDWESKLS
jgi:hypothetical protein